MSKYQDRHNEHVARILQSLTKLQFEKNPGDCYLEITESKIDLGNSVESLRAESKEASKFQIQAHMSALQIIDDLEKESQKLKNQILHKKEVNKDLEEEIRDLWEENRDLKRVLRRLKDRFELQLDPTDCTHLLTG